MTAEALKQTIASVIDKRVKRSTRCPAHEDKRASLSVAWGEQGRVLLHCHAGCTFDQIVTAGNLNRSFLAGDSPKAKTTNKTIAATYQYADEQGVLLYEVVRYKPKNFRQRRPDGKGGWIWNLGDSRRVIHGLPDVRRRITDPDARLYRETHGLPHDVFITEGERDDEKLWTRGLIATTNAGGAGKWRPEYTQQLVEAGATSIVVLPDADEPGRQHGQQVAASCRAAGLTVKVVELPGLPLKGDVSDFLSGPGDRLPELLALVVAAPLWTPTDSTPVSAEPASSSDADRAPRPVLVRLADVQPESITWQWPGRVAVGKLGLVVGDPGLGKSWITLDIAARLSAGRSWPDGAPAVPAADVVLLSAEDGLADTIRPRLDRLGADVTRVHHLAVLRIGEHERAVQLADSSIVEQAIVETGAKLVIIDPVSAYLGSTDSHRDAEVRSLMAPLAAVAERTGAAIIGVMHLAKSTQRPAIYRAVGSIAFAAAARIVLAVAADPDRDDRRILAPIKSNLSAPPAALAYTLSDGVLAWDADPVADVDVTALLNGPMGERDRDEQSDADQLIAELLDDDTWPMPAADAMRAAQQHGIVERTFRRAAKRRGIRIEKAGFGASGKWLWHRPVIADAPHSGQRVPLADTRAEIVSFPNDLLRGHKGDTDTLSAPSVPLVSPLQNTKETAPIAAPDPLRGHRVRNGLDDNADGGFDV